MKALATIFVFTAAITAFGIRAANAQSVDTNLRLSTAAETTTSLDMREINRIRATGIAMTSMGILCALGGTASFLALHFESGEGDPGLGAPLAYGSLGLTLLTSAIIYLAAGIPVWAIGDARRRSARRSAARLPTPSVAYSPQGSTYSFGLSGRF